MTALPRHGYLLDMDGVLYRGKSPIEHAPEFIQRLQQQDIPFLFLTNHSCLSPAGFAAKLRGMGLDIAPERIYSSAQATAQWLAGQGVRRVHALGETGLFEALEECGVETASDDVSHVVVGLDRALTYEKLLVASRLILSGATFIVTNPDPTYPIEDGDAPECGLMLGALQGTTGIEPTIIGKPSPIIYRQAAERLGLPVESLTMIGDRLDTDIAGARAAGARSLLVLTGHTSREMVSESRLQPDGVLQDLSELERS